MSELRLAASVAVLALFACTTSYSQVADNATEFALGKALVGEHHWATMQPEAAFTSALVAAAEPSLAGESSLATDSARDRAYEKDYEAAIVEFQHGGLADTAVQALGAVLRGLSAGNPLRLEIELNEFQLQQVGLS